MVILKKQPIQKVYASPTLKIKPSSGASTSAVTELVAEPIPTNTKLENNIADSDDEQIPDLKTESPNPIQTLPQLTAAKPPQTQPTAGKLPQPAMQKQLQQIILFKESKLTKLNK